MGSRSGTAVWSRQVPEHVAALSTLVGPDYVDSFSTTLPAPPSERPAQMVDASFQASPLWLRLVVPFAQRTVLGLRIEPHSSPEHPIGWEITGAGDDWLRLGATSSIVSAELAGTIEDRRVTIATFIRYERWPARVLWPPVSLAHRRVGLTLLRALSRVPAPSIST